MHGFTQSLTLTELDLNWQLWRLEENLVYTRPTEKQIVVPKNFVTDGASVPRFFWAVLPAWGRYSRASVVHDFLCWRYHIKCPHEEGKTRKEIDLVFWEAMGVTNTGYITKLILYCGVRIGSLLNSPPNIVDDQNGDNPNITMVSPPITIIPQNGEVIPSVIKDGENG